MKQVHSMSAAWSVCVSDHSFMSMSARSCGPLEKLGPETCWSECPRPVTWYIKHILWQAFMLLRKRRGLGNSSWLCVSAVSISGCICAYGRDKPSLHSSWPWGHGAAAASLLAACWVWKPQTCILSPLILLFFVCGVTFCFGLFVCFFK